MEGAALRAEREHDRNMTLAWNTAMFALNGYGGKLKGKSLDDYLINKPKKSTLASAMAFFSQMQARGFPVRVYRTPAKVRATVQ